MYWGHHYWGMHVFWWIFWVALTAALVVWIWPRLRHGAPAHEDDATEVLRRRYAAGEVSDEEFRHRLAVLEERARTAATPPRAAAPTDDVDAHPAAGA